MYQRILVAVDLSDASSDALRAALGVAEPNTELAMIHVLPDLLETHRLQPKGELSSLPAFAELADKARQKIEQWSDLAENDAKLELFLDSGGPAAKVIERAESWGADLIIVGSHGRSGVEWLLLGSVAERIVHAAHCPVMVVRRGRGSGNVVAATDLSDPSLPAITHGAAHARRLRTPLTVVHVVDPSPARYAASVGVLFGVTVAMPPIELQQEERDIAVNNMQQAMARLGVDGEATVKYGKPAEAILQCATEHDADLIVVGTHGRSGMMRLALGSVADSILRQAHCSVLVVRLAPPA